MMDTEHKRKRKRYLKVYSQAQIFSLKSLVLCFSFFVLYVFISSDWFPIRATLLGPVLGVSRLSLLSSSSSNSVMESFSVYGKLPVRIEARVLFPDHLLLLVSSGVQRRDNLECVYHRNLTTLSEEVEDGMMDEVLVQPVISIEEYDDYRLIVRCLLPPRNYSNAVSLRRIGVVNGGGLRLRSNQAAHSWDSVAYSALLDGDSVVVFVKGLSLRPGRESDATHFSCRFGLSNFDNNESFVLTTEAITAAQEVVRCKLPRSIRKNPNKVEGIGVTVDHFYTSRGLPVRFTVPSVAKIYGPELSDRKLNKEKYELCVCTMVWNQAASLREWIEYHSWLGVERWFIYDNNSDDGTDKVIEELESEDFKVTRQNWPWIKTQEAGFSHCALRAKDECNWVGYFDVDEFFYFPYPTPQHPGIGIPGQNTLRDLVANYSDSTTVGEIRTDCHSFGPSGLRSIPAQGATVGYTCRLKHPERHKSIIRPDALDPTLLNVVHHFRLNEGFTSLNLPQSIAVINHYKYQVWESFRAKFYRRVATYVVDWQENQNEGSKDRAPGLGTEAIEPPNWSQKFCEVWDTGLRDFVLANLADPASGSLPWDKSLL